MKTKIVLTCIAVICLLLCSVFSLMAAQAPNIVVKSPNGQVSAAISLNDAGCLTYSLKNRGETVLLPSPIGIIVDGNDLGTNAKLGQPAFSEINETYPTRGVHSTAVNYCKVATIPVTGGPSNTPWTLEFRLFDDGAAYRYVVPGNGTRRVNGESSAWILPSNATVWSQDNIGCYEGLFAKAKVSELTPEKVVGSPVTVELPDGIGYAVVSEANLVNYSDMALKVTPQGGLSALFHADKEGWNATGDIISPWRVTMVSPDLNGLVNSDIHHNLCPPASKELALADWIQPGRTVWQWWSSGAPKYSEQRKWVDWAKQLGFEYYLIDEGWRNWKDGDKDQWKCLKGVVDYANTQNVKVVIWVHSKEVFDPSDRKTYFDNAKRAGVAGLKIDFPPAARLDWVNWYDDVLREAAALHLLVDFHGAVKPSGRDRTWPNEISREAVRGHEWHINRYHRILPPEHDAVLPFNRYLAGHGDYTPTVFNPDELHGYTWARELAQAIVFTSPFLCYADRPDHYLGNESIDLLKSIPSVWDETVVLPGSKVGSVAAFARRSGKEWFIGVINSGETAELNLPLGFLGQGTYSVDQWADAPDRNDSWSRKNYSVGAKDSIPLTIRGKGGFVARLTPLP